MRKTLRGSNSLGEGNLDALRFYELEQPFAVSAHIAINFGQCWEFFAFGLANILSRELRPSLCAQWKERARFCTHMAKHCQGTVRPIGLRTCCSTIRNTLAQSVAR